MPVEKIAPAQVVGVRFDVVGRYPSDGLLLLRQEFDLELLDDRMRDLVLDREDVREIAIKTLPPNVCAVVAIDELASHSHACSRLAHTTFHYESDSELPPDLLHL